MEAEQFGGRERHTRDGVLAMHRAVVDGRDPKIRQRSVRENLVERDQIGPEREERRIVLHPREVPRVLQQDLLRGLVEDRHHTGHVGHRLVDTDLIARAADDQPQFGFRGDAPDPRRHDDRLTRSDDGVIALDERRGRRAGGLLAEIAGMRTVIEADAEDLARSRPRRGDR